jgi:hypothetical protein
MDGFNPVVEPDAKFIGRNAIVKLAVDSSVRRDRIAFVFANRK